MTSSFYGAFHWWLLIWPRHLSPLWNYYVPAMAIITDPTDVRNVATLAAFVTLFAGLVYALIVQRNKAVGCTVGYSMGLLFFIPCSSLIFPVGFQVPRCKIESPASLFIALSLCLSLPLSTSLYLSLPLSSPLSLYFIRACLVFAQPPPPLSLTPLPLPLLLRRIR